MHKENIFDLFNAQHANEPPHESEIVKATDVTTEVVTAPLDPIPTPTPEPTPEPTPTPPTPEQPPEPEKKEGEKTDA